MNIPHQPNTIWRDKLGYPWYVTALGNLVPPKGLGEQHPKPENYGPFELLETETDRATYSAAAGFNLLLDLQLQVEEGWGRAIDPLEAEDVSAYVRDVILCATDELHEVLAEVHWKPWKDKRGIKDIAKYREEMADVLHFILDLYLAAGLTGDDIVADYIAKNTENMLRLKSAEYRAS